VPTVTRAIWIGQTLILQQEKIQVLAEGLSPEFQCQQIIIRRCKILDSQKAKTGWEH
jgi:hypothetical protein